VFMPGMAAHVSLKKVAVVHGPIFRFRV
jgi:hypothetical protein